MTPTIKDTQPELDGQAAQATFRTFVQEQVRQAIRATFIDILETEVTQFIGAGRYERASQRHDQRAGHRSRTLGTTAGVIDALPVPRTRGGFHTSSLRAPSAVWLRLTISCAICSSEASANARWVRWSNS